MNVKKAFFTLVALLCLNSGWSQQIVDNICMQVIGSNGLSAEKLGKHYDATLGEVMTATLTSTDASMTVTQGFHQPECALEMVGTGDVAVEWQLEVYPNPTPSLLYLKYAYTDANVLQARVWSIDGMLLSDWLATPSQSALDCSTYPAGLYFLEIQDPSTGQKSTIRFVKTTH